ncbi:MAG: hypothetical protein LBG71_00350 [Clostridiales Family XIII bacterium]|jgi:hypothetical protein|nr:hypothetical protein [Clostridiales Family XIII bacterium]
MKWDISFKKALSYGLVAGVLLGSAVISASAAGVGKQWFSNLGLATAREAAASEAVTDNGETAPLDGETLGPGSPPEQGLRAERRLTGGKGLLMNPDALVQDGVIDQATADRIKEYMANKKDTLSEMVEAGVITQAQADAIKAAQEAKMRPKAVSQGGVAWKGEGREGFGRGGDPMAGFNTDALVQSGIIDQATADKVKAFLDQEKEALAAEKEKIAGMTAEERQEYMASLTRSKPTDTLAKLVEAGILTQAQADAAKDAMPAKGGGHRGFRGAPPTDGTAPDAPNPASTVSFL